MVSNKNSYFFRKLTEKIVGNASSMKKKGDKCHTVPKAPSAHHHNDNQGKSKDGGFLPRLTSMKIEKQFDVAMETSLDLEFEMSNKSVGKGASAVQNKAPNSGLLAAKMKCDEWGLQNGNKKTMWFPQQKKGTSVASPQGTSVGGGVGASNQRRRHPMQRPGLVNYNKITHPSYKSPTVQRSTSMKERREALEKESKLCHQVASPLYRIDETDENEWD